MRHFKRRYVVYFTLYADSNITIKRRWRVIKAILGSIAMQKRIFEPNPLFREASKHMLDRLKYNLFVNILRPKGVDE